MGVVLYICLCGFPPFSDELNTPQNPFTLSQQIKSGRFDFPSPYWDTVGDSALDLIDRMLTVDVDKRITIDECLEHPWLTRRAINPADSTDGLTGAMDHLDFSKRKISRERTLLSSINEVKVATVIPAEDDKPPIKVWEKNANANRNVGKASQGGVHLKTNGVAPAKEDAPDAHREPNEFMEMGGKGDQPLFSEAGNSRYIVDKKLAAEGKHE